MNQDVGFPMQHPAAFRVLIFCVDLTGRHNLWGSTMKIRTAWPALAFFLCAGTLSAQANRFEITPFVGFETRGSYPVQDSVSVDALRANANVSFGTFLDYSISENMRAEFLWAHNPTSYSEHTIVTPQYVKAFNTQIDQFQFGGIFLLRGSGHKLRPYIGGGIGFTHDSNSGGNPNRTALAFNLGGGVKYELSRHVGFRGDLRWMPTYGSSNLGTICDEFGFCYTGTVHNYLERFNPTLGMTFRF